MIRSRRAAWAVGVWLLLASIVASAQPRAWLDRGRVALGETTTLHIETTQTGQPDYAPLQRDFVVSGHTSQRRFELVNGQARMRQLYSVTLRPQRAGAQSVPALAVGSQRTAPVPLTVTAGLPPVPARAGDDVFIESQADDADPYVQQAVSWVVRLYSAVPLVSGQLDQPAPQGASLQRIGDDAQYTRQIGARRYGVVERRFLLVPERSGELAMPPAVFEGRGAVGFFDSLFNRDGVLRARAAPRFLRVRPVPANAPQPWLPLHRLQLRYRDIPKQLKAGSAASLTVELTADGASTAQLPELLLPAIEGVQVLAEPPTTEDRFVEGRPQATVVRRFSLVPGAAGAVRLPALRLDWWDVRAGRAQVAALEPLDWQVAPGRGGAVPQAPGDTPRTSVGGDEARGPAPVRRWPWLPALLAGAAVCLVAAAWWARRRRGPSLPLAAQPPAPAGPAPAPRMSLRQVLDSGGLAEIEAALRTQVQPVAPSLAALRDQLGDPAQQAAIDALQQARWGGGDEQAARARLRAAFAGGLRLKAARSAAHPAGLPPLYPPG